MLKTVREKRGVSQQALAVMIGTSRGQIVQLEQRKRRLTVDWIDRIKVALGCSGAELIGEECPCQSRTEKNKEEAAIPFFIEDFNLGLYKEAMDTFEGYVQRKKLQLDESQAMGFIQNIYIVLKTGRKVDDNVLGVIENLMGK